MESPIDMDIRIVLTWDTDMTDLELQVTEPSGEKCYSFHNHTKNGKVPQVLLIFIHKPKNSNILFHRRVIIKGYGRRIRA